MPCVYGATSALRGNGLTHTSWKNGKNRYQVPEIGKVGNKLILCGEVVPPVFKPAIANAGSVESSRHAPRAVRPKPKASEMIPPATAGLSRRTQMEKERFRLQQTQQPNRDDEQRVARRCSLRLARRAVLWFAGRVLKMRIAFDLDDTLIPGRIPFDVEPVPAGVLRRWVCSESLRHGRDLHVECRNYRPTKLMRSHRFW
jgi:hypothetical protein